ncbi:MAG TPA: hypothetical protein VN157_11985, partial [Caulobacter sp.]|nr:hypothetical protein [Caulobacter sp.]
MSLHRLLIAGVIGPELVRWKAAGHAPIFWWRDDDARVLLRFLALGDVEERPDHARLGLLGLHAAAGHLHPEELAVAAPELAFADVAAGGDQCLAGLLAELLPGGQVGMDVARGLAHERFARAAHHLREFFVDPFMAAIHRQHDAHQRAVEDGAPLRRGAHELRLQLLAPGDVDDDPDRALAQVALAHRLARQRHPDQRAVELLHLDFGLVV